MLSTTNTSTHPETNGLVGTRISFYENKGNRSPHPVSKKLPSHGSQQDHGSLPGLPTESNALSDRKIKRLSDSSTSISTIGDSSTSTSTTGDSSTSISTNDRTNLTAHKVANDASPTQAEQPSAEVTASGNTQVKMELDPNTEYSDRYSTKTKWMSVKKWLTRSSSDQGTYKAKERVPVKSEKPPRETLTEMGDDSSIYPESEQDNVSSVSSYATSGSDRDNRSSVRRRIAAEPAWDDWDDRSSTSTGTYMASESTTIGGSRASLPKCPVQTEEDTKKSHPLVLCCRFGDTDQLERQLRNLPVMANGRFPLREGKRLEKLTPLMIASKYGQKDAAELLLQYDANIDKKSASGKTALFVAAASQHGSFDMLKWLLDHGADVNCQNNLGETPLIAVYRKSNDDDIRCCTDLLIKSGADVNKVDNYGGSPLSHAIMSSANVSTLKLLVNSGADVNSVDRFGDPLLYACYLLNIEAVRLLLTAGANSNYRSHCRLIELNKPGSKQDLVTARSFRIFPLLNDTPMSVVDRRVPTKRSPWVEKRMYSPEQIAKRHQLQENAREIKELLKLYNQAT